MQEVILSIVPTTYCENNCKYCYLGPLRSVNDILKPEDVESAVTLLKEHGYSIKGVQLFGGDLDNSRVRQKLGEDFFDKVYDITQNEEMGIIGKKGNIVSINKERKDFKENLKFITRHRDYSVISVVLPDTYKRGPKDLLDTLKSTGTWQGTLSIYQYFPSVLADVNYEMTNRQYCYFMIELLDEYAKGNYKFKLSIIDELERNRHGVRESVFGAVLYLIPGPHFADVRYVEDGKEYLKIFDSVEEWEDATARQKREVRDECNLCTYKDKCMAEHYRDWSDSDICCGLTPLIEWWEENHGRFNCKD